MIALRAKWTIRVDDLKTRLTLGGPHAEHRPESILVSLVINGLAPDTPGQLSDCLDYAPICHWITHEWPRLQATPLLESRVNELLGYLFGYDKRVQDAWVAVYRAGPSRGSTRVGVARQASRAQFQARLRSARD